MKSYSWSSAYFNFAHGGPHCSPRSHFIHCSLILFSISLMNNSSIIRWSVDLRWCVPDKPNGYYDLKVIPSHGHVFKIHNQYQTSLLTFAKCHCATLLVRDGRPLTTPSRSLASFAQTKNSRVKQDWSTCLVPLTFIAHLVCYCAIISAVFDSSFMFVS